MDPATARTILLILTGVAAAIWLAGFTVVTLVSRSAGTDAPELDHISAEDDLARSRHASPSFRGSAEVEGTPEELSAKLAAVLANWMVPGSITIEERTSDRLRFLSARGMPGFGIARCDEGLVTFKPVSATRTLVSYTINYPTRRWMILLAKLFLLLGLAAIIVGYWALSTYAIPSPNPGARAQVIQMFQTIHFLWPPFLFAFLHRQLRRMAQTQMQATIQNLPYLDPSRPPANPNWRS